MTSHVNREWTCWNGEGMRPIKDADQFKDEQLLLEGGDDVLEFKNEDRQFPVLCPVAGYDTCPNVEPAVPPSNPTANPLGLCHCDQEFWRKTTYLRP